MQVLTSSCDCDVKQVGILQEPESSMGEVWIKAGTQNNHISFVALKCMGSAHYQGMQVTNTVGAFCSDRQRRPNLYAPLSGLGP